MFARGFFRGFSVRWVFSIVGALLALAGGILVLASVLSTAPSTFTMSLAFRLILGIAALFGASRIYRAGKAILFARARLSGAGILTGVIGVLLFLLGFGTGAILVIAAGVAAFIGARF